MNGHTLTKQVTQINSVYAASLSPWSICPLAWVFQTALARSWKAPQHIAEMNDDHYPMDDGMTALTWLTGSPVKSGMFEAL